MNILRSIVAIHLWHAPVGRILDAIGVENRIITYGDTRHDNTEWTRRILVLAALRNTALTPFYTGQVAGALGGEPDDSGQDLEEIGP